MIARLMLMLVAGQLYGAAPLGLLGQVAAIVEILAAVAVLGLRRSLLDMLSADGVHVASTVKEALVSSLMMAAAMSLVLSLAWPYLFSATAMPPILYGAIPCIVFAEVAGTAIRFKRIIRWEVIARCVMEPWVFLAAALIYHFVLKDPAGLLSAYAFSAIAAAAGIAIGLSQSIGLSALLRAPFRWRALYLIPRKSLPVGITDIGVMMFRRLDVLLLSLVAGHQVTGIYYMAQQIVTVPHKIHQLFEPMMSPVVAKLHHAARRDLIGRKLEGICRWVFTLQLAVTTPLIMFAADILTLFGAQFAAGGLVLALLLAAELIDGSFALVETPLIFAKPSLPPKLVVLTLVLEMPAVLLLAYGGGAAGAAMGFLIAMAGLAAMRLIMLRRHLGIGVLGKGFLPPIIFGAAVAGLLALYQIMVPASVAIHFGVAVMASIAFYLLLVRLMALTPDDRSILEQLRAR